MRRGRPPIGAIAVLVLLVAGTVGACRGSPSGDGAGDGDGRPPASPTTVATAGSTLAPSAFGPGVLLGDIVDEGVTESSGLVASRQHPGRLWTHNDSDTPPELFCVEADGAPCGTWTVDGAVNVDWEDIAAGPGPGPDPGAHHLYIGDIGDNTRSRTDIVVYRIPEPTVATPDPATGTSAVGRTAPATAIRLRYDDGPHDAESLMVHPGTGDIYVVDKAVGAAAVYKARPEGGVLTRIGVLGLGLLGFATGGDISPDGRRVVVCTPATGFELTLGASTPDGGGDFDTIWDQPPVSVALPPRSQGEAVAYRLDGHALLLTSEGYPSPLFEVPRL